MDLMTMSDSLGGRQICSSKVLTAPDLRKLTVVGKSDYESLERSNLVEDLHRKVGEKNQLGALLGRQAIDRSASRR